MPRCKLLKSSVAAAAATCPVCVDCCPIAVAAITSDCAAREEKEKTERGVCKVCN